MLALLAPSWLPLVAALLGGMIIKWLLDLFFLRRGMFETQEALLTRERQITDLRHELNRSVEALKNRTTELDATVRAKAAAEALAAQKSAEHLEAGRKAEADFERLTRALEAERESAAALRGEVRTLLGHLAREREDRRAAESETLNLRLRSAVDAAGTLDRESALAGLRGALATAIGEADGLRPLLEATRNDLASQRTVNRALQDAVRLRDTTIEELRSKLSGAESEIRSVSGLLASQDEERARLEETRRALAEAEARGAAARAEADTARLELEALQTRRIDFDAALMLKEAQANAWEREYRNARGRAEAATAKAAQDARALEALRGELAACRTDLEAARTLAATDTEGMAADTTASRRLQDLETELATLSESHARLESQLGEARVSASRAEDLAEQLGIVEAELAALKLERSEASPPPPGDLETLLQDLDALTGERNRLAAEVAALKASGKGHDTD